MTRVSKATRACLRSAIERARIQVDQWDGVERGNGPEIDTLRERAETLIDILRDVAAIHKPHPPRRKE